ncbi:MAG: Tetratricopeptide 4, partial [Frankiales bacterium]|nr:Tetratricopeptide 4 [Frankiales bacterium]
GAPSYLGAALRLLGELAGPAGIGHLREAEVVLSPTTAALELARARLSLGSAPAVPDAEAVPLLEDALDAAAGCGAVGICRAAVAELERRGAAVPDPGEDLPGLERLTRTERRVLDLTRAGLSTHSVAQHLFLTPGTVTGILETASLRAGQRLK